MSEKSFKIATRGSPLALKQADMLARALKEAHSDLEIEIIPVKSAADWKKGEEERSLCEKDGGKGLFAKEIEEIILREEADCGVHSMKDMAAFLPEGLVINHVLPRADARDAFISEKYNSIKSLPMGATIGTCSVRRQALLLAQRPDLKIVPLRGNVQTRLDKVQAGQVEGSFLAMAGLERLGIQSSSIHPVSVEEMLPACGQGIVCMETHQGDQSVKEILDAIHCQKAGLCGFAEREVLRALDGSCHTPIGAYAVLENQVLTLHAVVASLDGKQLFRESMVVESCVDNQQAIECGQQVGQKLLDIVPKELLS